MWRKRVWFFLLFVTLLLATRLAAQPPTIHAMQLFYDKLAPYGDWTTVTSHGRVWVPQDTQPGWRPYTEGRWVYTDAGLTWVSEWAWGWAAFHYGRWLFHAQHGWAWVPGTVWAPAWVAWQTGEGWVGWASLPPQATWDATVGLSAERLDLIDIQPLRYVFVAQRQLLESALQPHLVDVAQNSTLLSLTRHITAYVLFQGRLHNRSLSIEQVAQLVQHPVSRHELQTFTPTSTDSSTQIQGKGVAMFRPTLLPFGSEQNPLQSEPRPSLSEPPATAPQPPRHTPEQRALEARIAAEHERMMAQQEREIELLITRGHTREDIDQQHKRERRAFEINAERERQVLAQRHKQRRKLRFELLYEEPFPLWRSPYE